MMKRETKRVDEHSACLDFSCRCAHTHAGKDTEARTLSQVLEHGGVIRSRILNVSENRLEGKSCRWMGGHCDEAT